MNLPGKQALRAAALIVVFGLMSACASPAVAPTAPPTAAAPAASPAVAASPAAAAPSPAAAAASPAVSPAAQASASPAALPAASPAAAGSPIPTAAAAAGGLQTVRIGLGSASASNAGIYVADGLGYFAEQGIKIDYAEFGSASEVVPSLSRGDLDVGDVGVNPAMFNAFARNIGIKLVADKGSMPPGFGFTSLVVPTSLAGQIKGPADLKGRKLAMTPPGLGTANGYVLNKWLATVNLTPKDVDIVPIAFPEQIAALTNHSVDAAIMAEPFATQAVNTGVGARVVTLDKIDPNQQVAGLVYSDQFIAQHKDLADKWMIAYVKGIRAYDAAFTAGQNKDQIISILAAKTTIKDTKLWAQIVPAGLNPDGKLNTQSIEDAEKFFASIGLIEASPPVSSFLDESFTDAAVKALGPAPTLPTRPPA